MNKIIVLILLIVSSCLSSKKNTNNNLKQTFELSNNIQKKELQKMLFTFASDEFKGREAGSKNEHLATEFIRNFYIQNGIQQAPGTNNYYQTIPFGSYPDLQNDANNVVAYIPGTDKADEYLIISAHLDHLGVKNGKIYNGADDDGSGTVAVMCIAKAFAEAAQKGYHPKRSVIFLHVTGEEKGLYGSRFYVKNPLFNLNQTIANLNIDMIGRTDNEHQIKGKPNYVYLIGSDKLSSELKEISEDVNEKYFQMELDYRYDSPNDPNRFYYRSDHYNFAKNNIPVIFYFNGTHLDYHEDTDTADKINYELLTRRTKLIFSTAWTIANRDNKPKLN